MIEQNKAKQYYVYASWDISLHLASPNRDPLTTDSFVEVELSNTQPESWWR